MRAVSLVSLQYDSPGDIIVAFIIHNAGLSSKKCRTEIRNRAVLKNKSLKFEMTTNQTAPAFDINRPPSKSLRAVAIVSPRRL